MPTVADRIYALVKEIWTGNNAGVPMHEFWGQELWKCADVLVNGSVQLPAPPAGTPPGFSPGPGEPPVEPPKPPPPPMGSGTIPWQIGNSLVDGPSAAGQSIGYALTPTAPGQYGALSFYEYGGPPCFKDLVISGTPGGPPLVLPWGQQLGQTNPNLRYYTGDIPQPGVQYIKLDVGTTYYVTATTSLAGGTRLEARLDNG